MKKRWIIALCCLVGLAIFLIAIKRKNEISFAKDANFSDRQDVVFWHFWGGPDRAVVDDVVRRFNESQSEYFVRAVAMPGNNLQAKLFLAVAGGDPPDLINQDDPILADWAIRGVIQPIDSISSAGDVPEVRRWMLPAAEQLSVFNNRLYGICNGLDIRALIYNQTALQEKGFSPPRTIAELDQIAAGFAQVRASIDTRSDSASLQPDERDSKIQAFGFLPDSRRLWAWGFVFGGNFLDSKQQVTLNTGPINAALTWMASYSRRYGADRIAAFRQGDQSLPGKAFPLLPVSDDENIGRYVVVMDGQWRVRDIYQFQERRKLLHRFAPEFGVCPLPIPTAENAQAVPRQNAGWVNGNFFVVPKGAKNGAGAWEFMKFWIGYPEAGEAAITCAAGGWIPVSQQVIDHANFQEFLVQRPLFRTFVELAGSPNQLPVPQVMGASMFRRTVDDAAYEAMTYPEKPIAEILQDAENRIQLHLNRLINSAPKTRLNR